MPALNTLTFTKIRLAALKIVACARGRKLEGEAPPVAVAVAVEAARRSVPAGTGREVPPEVLDSIRSLNRDQLVNMLTNYYHSIRGGLMGVQWSGNRFTTLKSLQ